MRMLCHAQAYLTDCLPRLQDDLERARRQGYKLGAKLVGLAVLFS